MKEVELNSFLTSDYIYLPFDNKDKLQLRNDGIAFKNEEITVYKDKLVCSSVSGKIFGISEINSLSGVINVLVIENDYKDDVSKKIVSKKDIYELDSSEVKEAVQDIIKINNNTLVLEVKCDNNYDFKDEFLIKDNIVSILETLNLIDQVYSNIRIKIKLNKKHISIYQLLFSYLGTYPNIELCFTNPKNDETLVSVYDVLDIFNKLKNSLVRDYIYVSVKNNNNVYVLKVKRYSNLKDLLEYLNLMSTKILINDKLKIESANFLLDDKVNTINII